MTWTNDRKDHDRRMPFHRVKSPWFLDANEQGKLVTLSTGQQRLVVGPEVQSVQEPVINADGKGYDCGCRSVDDFPIGTLLDDLKLRLLRLFGGLTFLGDPREVMHTLPGWVPV